jgi:uncharacterized protein (TIGR03382 family)
VACGRPPPTTTSLTGSVGGIEFRHPYAIYGKDPTSAGFLGGRAFILFSSDENACDHLTSTGLFTRSGISAGGAKHPPDRIPSLSLQLPEPASWGGRSTIGEGMAATFDLEGALTPASLGEITVDHFDDPATSGGNTAGTFNVGFTSASVSGAFTGSFSATPCTSLYPGCSSAGAGLLWPALLALTLAARRGRRHGGRGAKTAFSSLR